MLGGVGYDVDGLRLLRLERRLQQLCRDCPADGARGDDVEVISVEVHLGTSVDGHRPGCRWREPRARPLESTAGAGGGPGLVATADAAQPSVDSSAEFVATTGR